MEADIVWRDFRRV